MKTLLPLLSMLVLAGCFAEKKIEADMVNVQLVKIDTLYRFPNAQLALTWLSDKNVSYVTYEPLSKNFKVGSTMKVMMPR